MRIHAPNPAITTPFHVMLTDVKYLLVHVASERRDLISV